MSLNSNRFFLGKRYNLWYCCLSKQRHNFRGARQYMQ